MDELIGRLVADEGIDRNAAETAVGIILDFLAKEGPADKQFIAYARGKVGEDVLGEIAGAIPGLSQFV
jgi:hypothetical protein